MRKPLGRVARALALLLACATCAAQESRLAAGAAKGSLEPNAGTDAAYQEEVLQRCHGIWPERFKHGYAHYSGAMMEEFFFKWWSKRRPALPQTYLPIGWSTYFFSAARVTFNTSEVERAKQQTGEVLQWLDKRRSYFSVEQFAGLIRVEQLHIPCDLKLTLFVGGGIEDEAQAPHMKFVPIPLLSKVLQPTRQHRSKRVSFAGGFLHWQDPAGLRTEMRDLFQNRTGYYISDRVPDWEALIHESVYHMCPRGNGPTSYRLYEALQAQTIPIYIWEDVKWLAFEDVVDWNSISIIVHRKDMASIPDRINATDAPAMRAAIARTRGMWRYNYTSDYISKRVAATDTQAGLNDYRPNSTQCAAAAAAAASSGVLAVPQLSISSGGGGSGDAVNSQHGGNSVGAGSSSKASSGGAGAAAYSAETTGQAAAGTGSRLHSQPGQRRLQTLLAAAVGLVVVYVCVRAARKRRRRLQSQAHRRR